MVSNIWVAAADNQVKIVESYLDSGNFKPDVKDPNGYTPIHAAASYGHIGLLKTLISRGGDINVQDNEGDTPLHHVEDIKTAKVMINELGADYKLKNNDGQTAADYIEEDDEFPELAQYLRTLAHDKPAAEGTSVGSSDDLIGSLPAPGTVDGHQIRYTLENDASGDYTATPEEEEERRKKLEAIVNSENPEEALRELVTLAVRQGFADYNQELQQELEEGPSKKRK